MLFSLACFAQVGVGTTTPNGALDVSSSTNGFVPPRVSLTSTALEAPVVNPQGGAIPAGTMVWNTNTSSPTPATAVAPGLYYWDGSRWVAFAGSPGGLDWSLTGNSGTTVGTNFLGTTDNQDFAINTNNIERARVLASNGHVLVNTTTNDATSGADNIFEVLATNSGDDAINGYATGTGIGVYGTTSGDGIGVRGASNSTNSLAMFGSNANTGGTGIVGAGGGTGGSYYPTSGVSGNGTDTGAAGMAETVATGVGVRGNGNGVSTNTTSGVGAGVAGSGTNIGVFGHASNTSGNKNGGVFTSEHGTAGTPDNPYAY